MNEEKEKKGLVFQSPGPVEKFNYHRRINRHRVDFSIQLFPHPALEAPDPPKKRWIKFRLRNIQASWKKI